MTQALPLVPADAELASSNVGRALAPAPQASPPSPASNAVSLATLAVDQDPAQQVQALAKGAALAEQRAQETENATDDVGEVLGDVLGGQECDSSGFGGVADHVAQAGHHLQEKFDVDDGDVGGVADRPNNPTSDHPSGYALDFMVDRETGDAIEAYAEEHTDELGIKYILWEVENHYDHVHLSFNDEPGSGLPC